MPEKTPTAPREIVVISGKGGTGKTSVTAALAHTAHIAARTGAAGPLLCDLDVDAPDLHILLAPDIRRREAFVSGFQARILPELCTACGACAEHCRFGAVVEAHGVYAVDPMRCEGCKVCVAVCPTEDSARAVAFEPRDCGEWFVSTSRFGPMVHARLRPGEENSGRLVALLKQQAREMAAAQGLAAILCDGAPGVGCPVISSLSGAHLAVAVTEPTPSGRHDLERVAELCVGFKVPLAVVLNKDGLCAEEADRIASFCREGGHELVARLPFDPVHTRAHLARRTVTETDGALAREFDRLWRRLLKLAAPPERELKELTL